MKHKKVAIFLRGYQRTWKHLQAHTFALFEQIYGKENIDWYVAFWETKTTFYDQILESFKNKNLISLELVNESLYMIPQYKRQPTRTVDFNEQLPYFCDWNTYTDPYWRLAFLDLRLIFKKNQTEIETKNYYNQVIFIRPDVFYLADDVEKEKVELTEFVIYGVNLNNSNTIDAELKAFDLYYKAKSLTADIISSRFLDLFSVFNKKQFVHSCAHTLMGQYLLRNYIREPQVAHRNVSCLLLRPTMVNHIPLVDNNVDELEYLILEWRRMSDDERTAICVQHNIDPVEYLSI